MQRCSSPTCCCALLANWLKEYCHSIPLFITHIQKYHLTQNVGFVLLVFTYNCVKLFHVGACQ